MVWKSFTARRGCRCTVVDTTAGRKKPHSGADWSWFAGDSGDAAPAHQQGVRFTTLNDLPSPRLAVLPLVVCLCAGTVTSWSCSRHHRSTQLFRVKAAAAHHRQFPTDHLYRRAFHQRLCLPFFVVVSFALSARWFHRSHQSVQLARLACWSVAVSLPPVFLTSGAVGLSDADRFIFADCTAMSTGAISHWD